MISKLTLTAIIALATAFLTVEQPKPDAVPSYGSAHVTTVHRLDEHVRLYCDIAEFPPVVGQNIPVCIKGLKPASSPQDNLKLLMFLNDLFLSKTHTPAKIILKDIQRAQQFCLVADIDVDGKDLCDLLVEKKLAQRVIEVPQLKTPSSKAAAQDRTPVAPAAVDTHYMASKSSKVYHLPACPHATRMDTSKSVTFATREDAEKTGRRPCKTCKP